MRDYPILMAGEMVRRLLDEIRRPGTGKTQTRRMGTRPGHWADEPMHVPTIWFKVKPGDRLWVRERIERSGGLAQYEADRHTSRHLWPAQWKRDYAPGMHCPRLFSRITLEVSAARIERVQAISEDDARAEGVAKSPKPAFADSSYRAGFRAIWCQLHGTDAWDDNPEVIAFTFQPILCNIDLMPHA